jgi:predicted DNA-binding transcriptional regulator AlpA
MENTNNRNEQFLNDKQLAEMLNMKPETLKNWRWEGKGPIFIKIGRNVRYRMSDVLNYINGNVRTSTTDTGEFCDA